MAAPSWRQRRQAQGWSAVRRHLFLISRGGACQACGESIEVYWGRGANRPYGLFEIDHIVPLQFGGADHRKNMAVLCPGCHRRKSQREAIWGCTVCAVHGVTYDPYGPSSSLGATHGVQCLRQPSSSEAHRTTTIERGGARGDGATGRRATGDGATGGGAAGWAEAEEEEEEMNDFSAYAYAPPLLPLQTARDF